MGLRPVIPLLHPASVVRGQWAKEAAQEIYIQRTKAWNWPFDGHIDLAKGPPGSVLFPSLANLNEFRAQVKDGVSIDLENAGKYTICMGLTALDMDTLEPGPSLCLRWRLAKGVRYWTWPDHLKAAEWAYDLLADPTIAKVFHNGVTHDVPLLEADGFRVEGRLIDTMILMRLAYSEMQSGLQFCGTLWLGMPVWKSMLDEEDEDK
jgi:hypothetical protein